MSNSNFMLTSIVRFLTPAVVFLSGGCALIDHHYGETCNSRAYLHTNIQEYITRRFHSKAPVRMAVIPFSVPANLASRNNERNGMENTIAWTLHAELLRSGEIPIVEVLNRQDWPGKKEEFHTGNFNAIQFAREAGYDLVLVGYVEPINRIDTLQASTKIIEVESGSTIWYGLTTVRTYRADIHEVWSTVALEEQRPDMLYTPVLVESMAKCIVRSSLSEDDN